MPATPLSLGVPANGNVRCCAVARNKYFSARENRDADRESSQSPGSRAASSCPRFHRQIHHRPKNSCQNLSPAKVTINVHAMDEKMMQAMKAWSLL
jgi:hypothetical protein